MHSLELIRAAQLAGQLVKEVLGYSDSRCQICNRPLSCHCSATHCCGTSLCTNCFQGWQIMGDDCIICARPKAACAGIGS